jgi:hypothetical protein
MSTLAKVVSMVALCCAARIAAAQQPPGAPPASPNAAPAATGTPPKSPAKATAQSEAGDPRADTANPAMPEPAPATAAGPPKNSAGALPGGKVPATAAAPATGRTSAGRPPPAAAKADRLNLGTATVTGDREQPKVMYIVPWKQSDIGDLAGKPMNSLVDEILSPVDRDVFKREVIYYRAVQADASQNGAAPKPAQQGEK